MGLSYARLANCGRQLCKAGMTASRYPCGPGGRAYADRGAAPIEPSALGSRAFFIRNQGFVAPTAARRISFEDSLRFERIHEQTYAELGFRLVEVPAGPLADRVALIRQTVGRRRRDG